MIVSGPLPTIDVLAIQFWIHDPALIRDAVHAAGFIARIKRIDIEPALHAALGRQPWHLVIYDPATPDLSLETVRRAMRAFRRRVPVVIVGDVTPLVEQVRRVLQHRRS